MMPTDTPNGYIQCAICRRPFHLRDIWDHAREHNRKIAKARARKVITIVGLPGIRGGVGSRWADE